MERFLYTLDFYIMPSKRSQFEKNFEKIMEAHHNHDKGLGHRLTLYRTFVGGDDVLSLSIPMESLGDMDLWMHTPEIVIEYFGEEMGIRILNDYSAAMKVWKSKITKRYEFNTAI
ncbi:hypothetical protein B7C51_09085 [Paenibacillus larvae subsp. pulvifaciens]|uniref:DUF3303 domain-containing protein n=1 Tax=Paenibacillus larvae subsp. pulvifaciens TaxID=1477 RepID=A0A1V0USM4_9BACL|nr:hypothetical protein [Paenibacillus larvae]ARF67948.1 hypothetical protein B7C51_09085 [Paenibacillus larvae subsp. pulvifaciens]